MKSANGQTAPASFSVKKTLHLQIAGKVRRIDLTLDQKNGTWQIVLDGKPLKANALLLQPGVLGLILNGHMYRCLLDENPGLTAVFVNQQRFSSEVHDPRSLMARRQKGSMDGGEQTIKAPMPGRIVRVLVEPGQEITAHQPVVAIEAMKMQNELKAIRAGKVKEVRVSVGQTVAATEIVVVIS